MKYYRHTTTKFKIITDIITALIWAAFVIYLIIEWKSIPDMVATHFGISGDADAYGAKNSLIILPAIGVIICAGLSVLEHFPQAWNFPVKITEKNQERLYADGLKLLSTLKILIAILFSYIGGCSANGVPVSWPIYVIFGAVLLDIVISFIKMSKDKNGCRT